MAGLSALAFLPAVGRAQTNASIPIAWLQDLYWRWGYNHPMRNGFMIVGPS